ncbi:MAG: cytochrome c oxidase subunit II, partial [Puniceicoccaceae bacterium]
ANMRFSVISLEEDEWEAWVARQQEDARTVTEETVAATAPREDFRIDLASLAWPSGPRSSGAPHGGTPMDFWRSMQEPPEQENPELIAEGRRYFRELACIGCHTIRGHESMGITGPDLTHYGSRTTIASALLDNTPENLYRWLRFPEHVKPGNIMYRDGYAAAGLEVTSEQAEAMVAYLLSLK